MNGGYVIIDCSGIDLGNLGEVPGIYDRAKAAIDTGKPLVCSGIVNGSQAFTPIVGFGGVESGSSVFISFYPVTLHISNLDVVTM